jgi:hypothetical protein
MDILIAIDDLNLKKLQKALYEFGAPTVPSDHFKEKGNIFRMGRSPIRIEIINEASGISFKECYMRRKVIAVDDVEISLIAKKDLIKNKKASGRTKDLADVENLESIKEK